MVLGITRTNNTTKKRTLYGANKEIKVWMMTLLEITKHVWISQQCCDLRGSHVFLISFFDMKEKTNVSNQNKSLVAVFWRPLDFNLKSFILKLAFWNPFLSQTSNLPIKDKQPHPSGVNDEWMMFFFFGFFFACLTSTSLVTSFTPRFGGFQGKGGSSNLWFFNGNVYVAIQQRYSSEYIILTYMDHTWPQQVGKLVLKFSISMILFGPLVAEKIHCVHQTRALILAGCLSWKSRAAMLVAMLRW